MEPRSHNLSVWLAGLFLLWASALPAPDADVVEVCRKASGTLAAQRKSTVDSLFTELGEGRTNPEAVEDVIPKVRTVGFANDQVAAQLRAREVPPPAGTARWTGTAVGEAYERSLTRALAPWAGKEVRFRNDQEGIVNELTRRGFSDSDIAAVFNRLKVAGQEWNGTLIHRKFREATAAQKVLAEFPRDRDFTEDEKVRAITKLMEASLSEVRIAETLKREGISPPGTEKEWTAKVVESTLGAIIDSYFKPHSQGGLSVRQVQNEIFQKLEALGLSDRAILRAVNAHGMPAPKGGEWARKTVRARLDQIARGEGLVSNVTSRYPWQPNLDRAALIASLAPLKGKICSEADFTKAVEWLRNNGLTYRQIHELLQQEKITYDEDGESIHEATIYFRHRLHQANTIAKYQTGAFRHRAALDIIGELDRAGITPDKIFDFMKSRYRDAEGEKTLTLEQVVDVLTRGLGSRFYFDQEFKDPSRARAILSEADTVMATVDRSRARRRVTPGAMRLEPSEELSLLRAMNLLRWRAVTASRETGPFPSAAKEASIKADHARAEQYRQALADTQLTIVYSNARKMAPRGVAADEWYGVGTEALLRAIDYFDPAKKNKFFTYAKEAVSHSIARAVGEYQKQTKKEKTAGQTEDGGVDIVSSAPDRKGAAPDANLDNEDRLVVMREAVKLLEGNERRVIELRYGLGKESAMTFAEIGDVVGLTKQRVHMIHKEAIEKLVTRMRGKTDIDEDED